MFLKFNENKMNDKNLHSESGDIFDLNYDKWEIEKREKFLSDIEENVNIDMEKILETEISGMIIVNIHHETGESSNKEKEEEDNEENMNDLKKFISKRRKFPQTLISDSD